MSALPILQWSESQKSMILGKFGRTIETVRQDIENIKTWMKKQPHLPEIPDDMVIESFLLINKFRIEVAKKKLDMYYTVRTLIPEFFDKDPNSPFMQQLMDDMYVIPLPKLTDDLQRVVIYKYKNPNNEYDGVAFISHLFNVVEMRLRYEYSSEEVHIHDLAGITMTFLMKFSPAVVKKAIFVIEKVFSSSPQGIHYVNVSSTVDSFISLIKSLLTEKYRQRVFSHRNAESLHKFVPKSVLPADYGGDEISLEELNSQWKKTFLENDLVFKHLRGLKVDEKLRTNNYEHDILI